MSQNFKNSKGSLRGFWDFILFPLLVGLCVIVVAPIVFGLMIVFGIPWAIGMNALEETNKDD
jgi:hypothetical protein